MTSNIMRVAMATANALRVDGFDIPTEVTAQLTASGVTGPGISRLEEAIRFKIPYVLDLAGFERDRQLGRWDHQLHRGLMIERAKKALCRAKERGRTSEQLDDLALDFKAQKIVTYVRDQIVHHGLTVYTQKLAFDPAYPREVKQRVLRGMAQADFGPVTATAAAAAGVLPPLPMETIADAVRRLAEIERIPGMWRMVGTTGSFRNWIEQHRPFLVEFPAPNLEAGRTAREDYFTNHQFVSELGLGFILVAHVDEFRRQYEVATPMLFTRRFADRPEQPIEYRMEVLTKVYPWHDKPYHDLNRPYEELARVLRDPKRNRVFRLNTCKQCGAVVASGHPELEHSHCTNNLENRNAP
jgi:hypothetical protein